MSKPNQQTASNEDTVWSELYQNPEDIAVARIVVEMLTADKSLLALHPALYIRASRTLRHHEARVRRWQVLAGILRGAWRLAFSFLKRVASMIGAGYIALIDANTKKEERPNFQEILKDPVLLKAFQEFLLQHKTEPVPEPKEAKAA